MKRKYKILLLLLTITLFGSVFFFPNVTADEGTKAEFADSEFFTTAIQIDITPYDRLATHYHDDNYIASSLKLGVSDFYNLGYRFYDNDTQKAYFLGKAVLDVRTQIYTTYSSPEQIFASGGIQESSKRWLDLYWQRHYPYWTDSQTWYEAHYDFDFMEIRNAQTVSGLIDGRPLGYNCDWKITTSYLDFNDFFAIPSKYSDEESVIFDVPQIQLVGGNVYDPTLNVGLETDYDINFINQNPSITWEGFSQIDTGNDGDDDVAQDVDADYKYDTLGLTYQGEIGTHQIHSAATNLPTNADLNTDIQSNTATLQLYSRPELTVYRQPYQYGYAEIYADVEGYDARVLSGSTVSQHNEYRVVGYKVDNQEIQTYTKLEFLVWGTAELPINLKDELLSSPEFIRGDVFWDISFWGDTSASVIFGESGIVSAWNNFWDDRAGLKTVIVIILILVLVGGGFVLYMNITGGAGLGGGRGSGEKATIFAGRGSTINYSDTDVDPSASKVASRQQGMANRQSAWIRKQNYRRSKRSRR